MPPQTKPKQADEKPKPKYTPAQVLLGEAASEGVLGLQFVRDVIANRARNQGKSMEEIVSAPYQFPAYDRKDLADFYLKQPSTLRKLAEQLIEEARQPDYQPAYPEENYVTTDLYATRNTLSPNHWINKMEPSRTVGHHVALRPRRHK